MEKWKDIKGYEGSYQVSNMGRVRSVDRIRYASNGKTMCKFFVKGQILKPSHTGKKTRNNDGYLAVNLLQKTKRVHRLVAEAFIPNPDNFPVVNHKDGNTENNKVENLEWCTNEYNQKHAITHGLKPQGEEVINHKLSQREVDEIRRIYKKGARGFGAKSLAKKYGVSDTTIRNILKGKKWRKSYEENNVYY